MSRCLTDGWVLRTDLKGMGRLLEVVSAGLVYEILVCWQLIVGRYISYEREGWKPGEQQGLVTLYSARSSNSRTKERKEENIEERYII